MAEIKCGFYFYLECVFHSGGGKDEAVVPSVWVISFLALGVLFVQ